MILYYDPDKQSWFHTEAEQEYTFGVDEIPVPYRNKPSSSSIPFHLGYRKKNNLGPFLGILAGRKNERNIIGNGPLFKKLQEEILDYGGLSFVFTLEHMREQQVDGYLYLPYKEQWLLVKLPIPHLVYNRLPFRKMEQTEQFQSAIRLFQKKDVCFFNPSFLDKYQLYKIFKEDAHLSRYFPETILIQDRLSLESFLDQHKDIYVKPSNAAKGRGIYRIMKNEKILVQGLKKNQTFTDFDELWKEYRAKLTKVPYIAQKSISPLLHEGNRYDFRVLAHFDGEKYIVTGIGIRQSVEQSVTTHIPNGGRLIPQQEVLKEKDKQFIQAVVQRCGEILTKEIGFFGEFSMDVGLTENEDYVIYEINSKPMSFDEKDIEEARVRQLVQLFGHSFYTDGKGFRYLF
ncbi:YheC/YheD family protein [Robertmurraya yapensis]|uniref:YheC/YheD family protein n=1 Tax=Bacillus yapensis TaxID=2492960 RepID=A0A3S0JXZ9_9BACI|nr:YheC/YheD family protein [Bacillus yapensis]RTR31392.1 YheC/YheD family protein [Bacillus yapensis]TKS95616.1 YheC/YheD family protein [Bacillus yapensis]